MEFSYSLVYFYVLDRFVHTVQGDLLGIIDVYNLLIRSGFLAYKILTVCERKSNG